VLARFEIDEAFHYQSELDAETRRLAAQGSLCAPGWWWEVERVESTRFHKPTVGLRRWVFRLPEELPDQTGNQHEN